MHILFVNYHWFENTSGIHIFYLANELERRGVRCTVLVPERPESVASFGTPRFSVETFRQARLRYMLHRPQDAEDGTLVHVWTPREVVRAPSLRLAARLRAPYLVHLEDNERHIYLAYRAAARRAGRRWNLKRTRRLIHPLHWRGFLAGAAGVTCIVDSLLRFRPEHVPGQVFWPACEPEIFDLPTTTDSALRRSLDIPDDAFVLFYPGNVHPANVEDVAELYRAVALLNQRGLPVWLVRAGQIDPHVAARLNPPQSIVEIGYRPASEIPQYLGAADVLVQPGRSDTFNAYRFPCKLPMFLASGRPVVLPDCNIGGHLRDGEHCLITHTGSAEEIAEKVSRLIADPALRRRLGDSGRAFASANLRWDVAADRLMQFYRQTLAAASHAPS
jgi:glycosyltransferase involved in cell wall biosynthesis